MIATLTKTVKKMADRVLIFIIRGSRSLSSFLSVHSSILCLMIRHAELLNFSPLRLVYLAFFEYVMPYTYNRKVSVDARTGL